jgi:hypothetical protein
MKVTLFRHCSLCRSSFAQVAAAQRDITTSEVGVVGEAGRSKEAKRTSGTCSGCVRLHSRLYSLYVASINNPTADTPTSWHDPLHRHHPTALPSPPSSLLPPLVTSVVSSPDVVSDEAAPAQRLTNAERPDDLHPNDGPGRGIAPRPRPGLRQLRVPQIHRIRLTTTTPEGRVRSSRRGGQEEQR